MLRTFACITMIVCVASCLLAAQDAPRAEVFGGYQYFRASTGLGLSGFDHFNLNGWNASVSGYFGKYVGVTGDFGGAYGTPKVLIIGVSTKVHTFMAGPVVRFPNSSKVTPFAHALFGGGNLSVGVLGFGVGSTDFTWAAGGGADMSLNKLFAVRVAQVDFLQTRFGGFQQNNFRYSAGLVIKF